MKVNYLIKATPLLSTVLIIIFLAISNQKEYTRLRILIWNTPSLTLGNYLAISTGSGFLLSYFITKNLARLNQKNPKEPLRFKEEEDKYADSIEYREKELDAYNDVTYDNTLIERDIKDPSPTINASFRIIGKKDKTYYDYKNYNNNADSVGFEEQYADQAENNEIINQDNSISSDWNDEAYSTW